MKKVIVLSLGGSIIIPNEVDALFLENFRKVINKNLKKYKFVVVIGGGSLARRYIAALKNRSAKVQSTAGIAATRSNAKLVSVFFDQDPKLNIPHTLKEVKNLIKKQDLVICGALGFKPKQTTDSTACEIAAALKTDFINLTNVSGLYDKNPHKHKNAKLIPKITWKDFYSIVSRLAYKPGQHFPLDQTSAKIIMENKIKAYIIGLNLENFNNLLNNKKFVGTTIAE